GSSAAVVAAAAAAVASRGGETHNHQHQHLHNHMHQHQHQHTYSGLSGLTAAPGGPPHPATHPAPLGPPAPPLFDKLPKAFDASVFRPSLVPSYGSAAFSSLLPPGPAGATLASSLHGAFQPKSLVPGATQLLVPPFHDREKTGAPPVSAPAPPALSLPAAVPKKQGKWCDVHVRVAWDIFHRQQKQHGGSGGTSSSSSSSNSHQAHHPGARDGGDGPPRPP
ncbi:hypothetical protein EGW08_009006, partial [Elysia chlorotica]